MVDEGFRRKNLGPQITGGAKIRFTDIDGIGPKTARKLEQVIGVNAPKDVADYSAEELAEEAGISKSRAEKAIRGGGGNPSFDERNTSTGSVAAGNLAEGLDETKQKAAGLVQERRGVFEQLVESGEEIPDRRERRRNPDANPFIGRDPDEIRQVGQTADIFSEATADPIDPTRDSPDLGFSEDDREKASQVRIAAIEALEEEEGLELDEASSEARGSPSNPPAFGRVESALPFGGMLTVGEFEVSQSAQEEAREDYAERSPEAKQVDSRRRAPVTTNPDLYEKRPGELDFPGIDTPTESPQVKQKDRKTVDADDTTLEQNTGSLFIRDNSHTGGYTPSLKGVLAGSRSPGTDTTKPAAQLAAEEMGANIQEDSGGEAVADITLLQREKEGFGEELIPFGAEESDKRTFDF